MPSDAAKNANTNLMKCCSPGVSFSQSFWSILRSISSLVQKDATCCFYIRYMSFYLIGNNTNRLFSSCKRNSSSLSFFSNISWWSDIPLFLVEVFSIIVDSLLLLNFFKLSTFWTSFIRVVSGVFCSFSLDCLLFTSSITESAHWAILLLRI